MNLQKASKFAVLFRISYLYFHTTKLWQKVFHWVISSSINLLYLWRVCTYLLLRSTYIMNIVISSVIWSEQEWKLQNLVFMYHHFYWNDCSPNECIDFYHIQSDETIECDNVSSNVKSIKWWKKSSQAQKKSKYYQNADWNHCHVSYMSHWKGIITYLLKYTFNQY